MEQNLINEMIEKLKTIEKGNTELYSSWYTILCLALQGMNYGEGNYANTGEINVIRRIKEKKHKKMILFDVGANVGNYSNLILQIFSDDDFELHVFEPSATAFETLQSKVNDDRVRLNRIGLDKENKEAVLHCDRDGSGLASLFDRQLDHFGIEFNRQEKISLGTLDDYCSKNRIDKIDFLKIDVEGNEINVLLGGGVMICQKKIKALQFEFGGCNIDSRTYFRDFWNMLHENYTLFKICKDGLHKIERYTENLEIFNCCNYYAELKELY